MSETLTETDAIIEEEEDYEDRGPERYAGYFYRIARTVKAVALRGQRYVAYSSDVGESFRPVANPMWVNASYGIAGLYIVGDVAYHGYQAKQRGHSDEGVARVVVETATFQVLASLLIPSVIIHQAVHVAQGVFKKGPLKKFGPVAVGLSLIPLMPYFDEPVEHGVEWVFNQIWENPDSHLLLHGHHGEGDEGQKEEEEVAESSSSKQKTD